MDNFSEEEIQRKIEEKRKRFIENAHRALGFYDQGILTSTDEQKKKRNELIEKEFNKVFDDQVKPTRKYDDEPAKPVILAASSFAQNSNTEMALDKSMKSTKESKQPYVESKKERFTHEDSLSIAEKEMESKFKPLMTSTDSSTKAQEGKTATPVLTTKKTIDKNQDYDEEEKELKSYEGSLSGSIKRAKEKAQNLKAKKDEFSDDEEIDTNSEEEYSALQIHNRQTSPPAKTKKAKKFVVNTRH